MICKFFTASLFFLLTFLGFVQAQEAILSGGGDATGSGGTVNYSIGQVAYTTVSGANNSVAEGVQQPYEISTILGIDQNQISLTASVYPNPTTGKLSLNVQSEDLTKFRLQLYDVQGKLLKSQELTESLTSIDLDQYPTATYILNILDGQALIKSFKIINN